MAATRARAFALLCLVAAARAGPKVKKPPKVELDESKLPPLESVLAELGVADVLPQLQAKGLDSTRQLCKWSRSDVSIHGMELGWSRDLQKEVLDKIEKTGNLHSSSRRAWDWKHRSSNPTARSSVEGMPQAHPDQAADPSERGRIQFG